MCRWPVLYLALLLGVPGAAWADAPAGGASDWAQVTTELTGLGASLQDAEQKLGRFSAENKLTAKGKSATSAAGKRVTAARAQLQSSLDAAKIMSSRPGAGSADATRFRETNRAVVAEAEAALVAVEGATGDAAHVDRSAEERADAARKAAEATAARNAERQSAEAKRAEAEAARKAAEREAADAKKADADRKNEERKAALSASLEAKKAADQNAAEAKKAAEEEKRLAAAAAAAAAAEKVRGELGAQISGVERALQEQHEREKPVRAQLGTFLSRTNLTSDARNSALKLTKKLDDAAVERVAISGKLTEVSQKPNASKALKDLDARAQVLARELTGVVQASSALTGNPKSFLDRGTGSAGSGRPDESIPTCEFTFEPADGKPMQVAIDGGAARSLPTRARLSSGRHTLLVRRERASEERRELLLCGHVATVPIEPLK